jgi:hypothetical protein
MYLYIIMPRRSSNPPLHERKLAPMKLPEQRNLPAIIPQRPSFLQTMKEGLALGIGSSIGHRIVGAVLGTAHTPAVNTKNEEYEKCIQDTNDKSGCEYLLRT